MTSVEITTFSVIRVYTGNSRRYAGNILLSLCNGINFGFQKPNDMHNNLVRLIGYIGKNLEAFTVSTGKRRLHLRVATHYYTIQSDGIKQYHTVWHDVVAWGQTAEFAERSFVKDSKIMVEGSIEYRTYQIKTGISDISQGLQRIVF